MKDHSKTRNRFIYLIIPLLLYLPLQSIQKFVENNMDSLAGSSLWFIVPPRLLIVFLPIMWYILIDRKRVVISKPTRMDQALGHAVGIVMLLAIVTAYFVYVWYFDAANDYSYLSLSTVGFVGIMLYFVIINPLVEEFNWRWFSSNKMVELGVNKVKTAFLIAFIFGIHHYITLYPAVGLAVAALATFFISGASLVWSWLNYRQGNFWSSYISHAWADVGVAVISWHFLFLS